MKKLPRTGAKLKLTPTEPIQSPKPGKNWRKSQLNKFEKVKGDLLRPNHFLRYNLAKIGN